MLSNVLQHSDDIASINGLVAAINQRISRDLTVSMGNNLADIFFYVGDEAGATKQLVKLYP